MSAKTCSSSVRSADQRGDVEEAAVVELAAGGAPEGEAVVLPLEQDVQRLDVVVDRLDLLVDGGGDRRVGRRTGPRAAGAGPPCRDGARSTLSRSVSSAWGRRPKAVARLASSSDGDLLLAPAPAGRRASAATTGSLVLVVADDERAALPLEHQLAVLEHPAVVVAEDRDEHLGDELALGRVPVDVEVARRSWTTGRSRARPTTTRWPAGDGHVVGDDVEDLAEPVLGPARCGHARVAVLAAELLVEARVVDDVVAVRAARRRLQVGRAVEVAHAEVGEVRRQRCRVVEGEPRRAAARGRSCSARGRGEDGHARATRRSTTTERASSGHLVAGLVAAGRLGRAGIGGVEGEVPLLAVRPGRHA